MGLSGEGRSTQRLVIGGQETNAKEFESALLHNAGNHVLGLLKGHVVLACC